MSLSRRHPLYQQTLRFSQSKHQLAAVALDVRRQIDDLLISPGARSFRKAVAAWRMGGGCINNSAQDQRDEREKSRFAASIAKKVAERDDAFAASVTTQKHVALHSISASYEITSSDSNQKTQQDAVAITLNSVALDIPVPPGATNIRQTPRRPGAPACSAV